MVHYLLWCVSLATSCGVLHLLWFSLLLVEGNGALPLVVCFSCILVYNSW
jgi:hypothetical protein